MCGIVGLISATAPVGRDIRPQLRTLLRMSESRGSEAAGLAVRTDKGIRIAKSAVAASAFTRSKSFDETLLFSDDELFSGCIAHTRLVTNGSAIFSANNQPVEFDEWVMVHNGIITNPEVLWDAIATPQDSRTDLDSAALLAFVASQEVRGASSVEAVTRAFGLLNGAASIAILNGRTEELILATNVGSLYMGFDCSERMVVFASERHILAKFREHRASAGLPAIARIEQLRAGFGCSIDCSTGLSSPFSLPPYQVRVDGHPSSADTIQKPTGLVPARQQTWQDDLRRCTACILPETFPFIEFDSAGVCSECRSYKPVTSPIGQELENILDRHRSVDGAPDCVVAFSGGRDSAYGLHRLVNDFGMTPLALTYDWGMVTDLARRNQARMCGSLGIEHVLISANIATKRRNIGLNLKAWIERPALGMVPLLMAGDKHFFSHARELAKNAEIDLVAFCTNPYEITLFKTGFAGVSGQQYYTGNIANKIRLMTYYTKSVIRNPRYINRSLIDSMRAFGVSYFNKHEYLQLFHHLPWEEDLVNQVLISKYGWETDPSTPTTWRIGDGTAPFYNWVYFAAAGFTENDTFRSNQVREGYIDRDRALEQAAIENEVRWERVEEYLDLVGVSLDEARSGVEQLVGTVGFAQSR